MTCRAITRHANSEDATPIADLYGRTLRDAFAGEMPQDFVDPVTGVDRASKIRSAIAQGACKYFVTHSGLDLVGFCAVSPARDDDLPLDVGEVTVLAVDRGHRRHGHGSALIRRARQEGAQRGFTSLVLWVVACNVEARAFYARAGFELDGAARTEGRLGFSASIVRYRAPCEGANTNANWRTT